MIQDNRQLGWGRDGMGTHQIGWLVRESFYEDKPYRRYILKTCKTPVTKVGVTVTEKNF